MAGSSLYQDDDGSGAITDINVTPFVDVVLVLLVVFIVTAKLIVARGVDIDKPKAATGGDVQSTLRVTIDKEGAVFVNGDRFAVAILTEDDKSTYGDAGMATVTLMAQALMPGGSIPGAGG